MKEVYVFCPTCEENTFRKLSSQGGKCSRIFQEINDVFQFLYSWSAQFSAWSKTKHVFGLVNAVHVAEFDDFPWCWFKLGLFRPSLDEASILEQNGEKSQHD
jgi:hypothetical protein